MTQILVKNTLSFGYDLMNNYTKYTFLLPSCHNEGKWVERTVIKFYKSFCPCFCVHVWESLFHNQIRRCQNFSLTIWSIFTILLYLCKLLMYRCPLSSKCSRWTICSWSITFVDWRCMAEFDSTASFLQTASKQFVCIWLTKTYVQ